MIKMVAGRVRNSETGVEKDIEVKASAPNDLKDILIGIGTVLVEVLPILQLRHLRMVLGHTKALRLMH